MVAGPMISSMQSTVTPRGWNARSDRARVARIVNALIGIVLLVVGSVAPDRGWAQQRHQAEPDVAQSRGGMVVSVREDASCIGREVLEEGGTAVDAAVATALALAVSWPEAGNIGGGGFMMVYRPATSGNRSAVTCVDYREVAPRNATANMFARDDGRYTRKIVGVPGTLRGLELAHQHYGRLPWKRLVTPAVRLARDGAKVDRFLAESLNKVLSVPEVRDATGDSRFAELRRVYGHPEGRQWKAGDLLRLPDLAETLTHVAEQGADVFYQGRVADLIASEMQRGDGRITKEDLQAYRAKIRQPIAGTFRGHTIYGPPPPSSGGVAVVEMLNILDQFELPKDERFAARTVHLLAEAARRAFYDRALYLGDKDFVDVPIEKLTSVEHAQQSARQISLERATPSEKLAQGITVADESPDTTHFSVLDKDGMGVANTYTLEHSWGSRVVVPGAGFVLNNEMGDFNWLPGYTDRAGRIGTPPNTIEPGKRMLSSQTPVIVARNGKVRLITGSPGGRTIINTVMNVVLNVVHYEMPVEQAVVAPRMHHQWFPDQLWFEAARDPRFSETVSQLKSMGHKVKSRRQGSAHSIAVDPEHGLATGVADYRRGGFAAGVSASP